MVYMQYVEKIISERSDMSAAAASTLRAIARRANNKTGLCWPSNRDMMQYTHLSRSTVKRAKNQLYDIGVLELVKTRRNNRNGAQTSNLYRVIADTAEFMVIAAKNAAYRAAEKARILELLATARLRKEQAAKDLAAIVKAAGRPSAVKNIIEKTKLFFLSNINPPQSQNEPPRTS